MADPHHYYEFGPFRLDKAERRLLRAGEPVQLTPKAFDILLLLVQNPGRLLDKGEILEAVWPNVFVEEANLTQYVFTLRKALGEQPGGEQYIETVPKKGYRFTARVREERAAARSFHRLTFRLGSIHAARFTADGVVYDAAWEGAARELYTAGPQSPESRPLGIGEAGLLAGPRAGELAISVRRRFLRGYVHSGTLARVSLSGGTPREVLEEVQWADWSPDGSGLAVVRDAEGRNRLEYPVGRVLYQTGGWVSHARVSPGGDLVAFIDHPTLSDDSGAIAVIDLAGRRRVLADGWVSAQGLAWSPAGDEVWFTAAREGNARALYAVTLAGKQRLLDRTAGGMTLHDIASDGRALLTRDTTRLGIVALAPGSGRERDMSWLDWSLVRDISADGRWLLFTEAGEAGGSTYGVYLRRTDGSPAVRLGDGSALALSPDGKWALAKTTSRPARLILLPTGAGQERVLESSGINCQQWACWFPDNSGVLFAGNEANCGTRLYVQDVRGGGPRTLTPGIEGVQLTTPHALSPDGELVAAVGPDQRVCFYPTAGGEPRHVPDTSDGDMPVRWSADGLTLYVRQRGEVPARIYRLALATGERALWSELMPADPSGVCEILRIVLTPDGEAYAYTYTRDLSDLFLAEGLG